MKDRLRDWVVPALLGLLVSPALGQTGTTFTYQGELKDGGVPANGPYDMDFLLWDALAGGAQQGSTITILGVPVADGLFAVDLDFGAEAMNGDPRWLEIVVETTTLSPRQPITAAPIASQLRGVFVNDAADFVGVGREHVITDAEYFGVHTPAGDGFYGGMYMTTEHAQGLPFYGYDAGADSINLAWHYYDGATRTWHLNNNGNRLSVESTGDVGIGTTTPFRQLEVARSQAFARLRSTSGSDGSVLELMAPSGLSNTIGAIDFLDGAGALLGSVYYRTSLVGNRLFLHNNGFDALAIDQNGNVGIGELFPAAKLDVNGTPGVDGIMFPDDTLQTTAAPEILSAAVFVDPPNVTANGSIHQSVTVTGADVGDAVIANPGASLGLVGISDVRVSSADTVTIHYLNPNNQAHNAGSSTWQFRIFK